MDRLKEEETAARLNMAGCTDAEIAELMGFDTAEEAHKAHRAYFLAVTGIDYDIVHAKTQEGL